MLQDKEETSKLRFETPRCVGRRPGEKEHVLVRGQIKYDPTLTRIKGSLFLQAVLMCLRRQ